MKGEDKGNHALRFPVAPVVFTSDLIRHKLKIIFMLEGRTLHQASSQSLLGRLVPIRGHGSGRAYEIREESNCSSTFRPSALGIRPQAPSCARKPYRCVTGPSMCTDHRTIGTCQVCPMAYMFVRGNTAYLPAFYSSQYCWWSS